MEQRLEHLTNMAGQSAGQRRIALSSALLLTWIAGLIDAIGFLAFARIYTANMSGNSVSLGIALAQQNWPTAFLRFWPVLTYVFGLLSGRVILELGARFRVSRIGTIVFVLESMLLLLAAWIGRMQPEWKPNPITFTAIALLAISMGAQNASLTRFSTVTVHTGFVTGTLLKAASESVKFVMVIFDNSRAGKAFGDAFRAAKSAEPARLSVFLWMIWCAYVVGAVIGGVSYAGMKVNAVAIAIGGLILLMAADLRAPLAVQEEEQQNKNS